MYTSIVTICEFVVIFMYLTRNCTVYVNKIYVLFCSVPDVTAECLRQADWGRCEFYECLERRFPCGSDGYINRVALHFCHKVATIFDSFNERVIK